MLPGRHPLGCTLLIHLRRGIQADHHKSNHPRADGTSYPVCYVPWSRARASLNRLCVGSPYLFASLFDIIFYGFRSRCKECEYLPRCSVGSSILVVRYTERKIRDVKRTRGLSSSNVRLLCDFLSVHSLTSLTLPRNRAIYNTHHYLMESNTAYFIQDLDSAAKLAHIGTKVMIPLYDQGASGLQSKCYLPPTHSIP